MRSMVEGACHQGRPLWKPPSVRPSVCHPLASGEDCLPQPAPCRLRHRVAAFHHPAGQCHGEALVPPPRRRAGIIVGRYRLRAAVDRGLLAGVVVLAGFDRVGVAAGADDEALFHPLLDLRPVGARIADDLDRSLGLVGVVPAEDRAAFERRMPGALTV